jgi:hypothetical protein
MSPVSSPKCESPEWPHLADSGGSQFLPKAADGKNGGAPRFRCMGNLAERQLSDLLTGGTRPTAAGGASSGERQGHPQKRTLPASKESSSPTLALSDKGDHPRARGTHGETSWKRTTWR